MNIVYCSFTSKVILKYIEINIKLYFSIYMEKSKIISLLKSFDNNDLKRFSSFLKSEFFNRNKKIIELFNALKINYPDFKSEQIQKEKIYSKLFPKSKFNNQVINNLASDLLKLVKKYLYVTHLISKQYFDNNYFLLMELHDRKLNDLLKGEFNKCINKLNFNELNEDLLFQYCRVLKLQEKILLTDNKNGVELLNNQTLQNKYSFILTSVQLLSNKIKHFSANESHNFKSEYDFIYDFIKDVNFELLVPKLDLINANISTYFLCYYYIYKSLLENNSEYLKKVFFLLNTNDKNISLESLYNIYNQLMNSCMRIASRGYPEVIPILFKIERNFLEKKLYKVGKHLTIYCARNIVWTAIYMKDFVWAEKFINDYKSDFSPSKEENEALFNYLLSIVCFEKGDFSKSLEHISKVNIETRTYSSKLDIKNLLLKIYYELNYIESSLHLVDSYRHFLRNNKHIIPKTYFKFESNFINIMNKLLQIRSNFNKRKDLPLLKATINNLEHPGIPFYGWFLQKIGELEKESTKL